MQLNLSNKLSIQIAGALADLIREHYDEFLATYVFDRLVDAISQEDLITLGNILDSLTGGVLEDGTHEPYTLQAYERDED